MGQRSQMYVRMNDKEGKKHLIAARYFQWNYGTRMVSRARYALEWLEINVRWAGSLLNPGWNEGRTKLKQILETNFDYKDVVLSTDIIEEFREFADERTSEEFRALAFEGQDNNDGQFLLDCVIDYSKPEKNGMPACEFRYAFVDPNKYEPMDAIQYMDWDDEDWRDSKYVPKSEVRWTERNARAIAKGARLMTAEEVEEFLGYDYVSSMDIRLKRRRKAGRR